MLKIILLVVILLAVGALAAVALRPNTFRVQRRATLKATPATIAALIDDFRAWSRWSPWEKTDPTMARTFEGAARGVGAVYGWSGGKAGTGRMEIIEQTPSRIAIKLDFIKPFEAHNMAIFALEPKDGGTEIVWTMEGPQPYVGKLMGLVFNSDKLVGGDFEKGLADLKRISES
ncbi:MAG: SRPBCC family protein [bacterium]|nr:SRPBCC family protein [bacterium]